MADPRRTAPMAFPPLLGWTTFVVLVMWAVLLGGGWQGIYAAGLRWMSLVLIAAGMAGWALLAWRRPVWRPHTAIWPALVVPLAAMALTTALSPRPRLGIEYVAWSVLVVALYLLLVRVLAWPYGRERIGGLAAVLCTGIGTWYLVVVGRTWFEWWDLVGHVSQPPLRPAFAGLTYGNPSAVMTIEVLLLVAAVAGLGLGTPTRRAIDIGLTALTAVVVVLSGSRAGWLAVAGALAIVGITWLLTQGHRGRMAGRLADRRARLGLVGVALALGMVAVVAAPGVLLRAGSGGDGGRLTYFATAWRMFETSPAAGTGPGSWAAQRIVFTAGDQIDYYVPHAHDIYLQTLAEHGFVGVAAGAVALATVGWLLLRAIRSGAPVRRRWGWAALFGLVYLGLHQVLDFYANMPAVLLALAIPLAWLDATSDGDVPIPGLPGGVPRPARIGASLGLVLAVGLSLVALTTWETTAQVEQAAVDTANAAGPAAALVDAQIAADADADMPPYQLTLGLAAAAAGDLADAESAIERSVAVDDLPQAWLDLAAIRLKQGDDAGARDALKSALRLGRQQALVAYAAGWLYDQAGDAAAADAAYVDALVLGPSLAGDPSWLSDPKLAARWPAILDEAIRQAPASGWEMALTAGDAGRALTLAAQAGDPAYATAFIRAWEGDEDIRADFENAADADPLDLTAVVASGRLANHLGDEAAADRYARWAGTVSNEAGNAVYELRIAVTPAPADDRAGNKASFHGHYVYRRPLPWNLLVPWLPRLAWE